MRARHASSNASPFSFPLIASIFLTDILHAAGEAGPGTGGWPNREFGNLLRRQYFPVVASTDYNYDPKVKSGPKVNIMLLR